MSKVNIFWCKNCLNTSTRPRITFDHRGWCNACVWMEEKKTLNWKKREEELINIFSKYRSKNNEFDCVVSVSGGKDGSHVAYTLKHKYKMNPLAINVTPPLPLKLGEENLKNFVASGFNLLQIYPNQEVMRFLNKRGFIDKGFPYFGWLTTIQSAVIKTALKFDLSLFFRGEDGEVEYGGSTETKHTSLISLEYQKKVWLEAGYDQILSQVPEKLKPDTFFWQFPTEQEIRQKGLYTTNWSYFENWDSYRNYLTAKNHCGLKEADASNISTFTNFAQNDQALYSLHTYLCYLKFGFGRALQDVGIEIRRGAMTRDQALNLVKIYDGQYPEEFINTYLEYYRMTKSEFDEVLDKWANKNLFRKENGKWKPLFTIE